MKEIDINKIRGQWQEWGNDTGNGMRPVAGGDDTIESIKMVAEKVNDLIEEVRYIRSLVLPLE